MHHITGFPSPFGQVQTVIRGTFANRLSVPLLADIHRVDHKRCRFIDVEDLKCTLCHANRLSDSHM